MDAGEWNSDGKVAKVVDDLDRPCGMYRCAILHHNHRMTVLLDPAHKVNHWTRQDLDIHSYCLSCSFLAVNRA